MDTTCRRDGSDYVLRGAKMWISFLDVASYYLTFAHLGADESTGRKRICAFIVDADAKGVSTHPLKNKYGFRRSRRASSSSRTCACRRRRSSARRDRASRSR